MTGKGHTIAGLICTIGAYKFTSELGGDVISCIASSLLMVFGATAPDWMEFRKKNGGTVINHRTWTHWLIPWIFLFIFGYSQVSVEPFFNLEFLAPLLEYFNIGLPNVIAFAVIGFSMGGLLHLLVDLPNPMGVPILTPYNRFSLKLWKSGKFEEAIYFFLILGNLYYLEVISFDLSKFLN